MENNPTPNTEESTLETLFTNIEQLSDSLKWQIFQKLTADLNNTQVIKSKVKFFTNNHTNTVFEDEINEFIKQNEITIIDIKPIATQNTVHAMVVYY